jgi:aspartate/methionine/tyrosine aminotransferase
MGQTRPRRRYTHFAILQDIFMPTTSQRIKGFGESVIRRMTRIANQYGAINLSQGFPDFDPPAELLAAAHEVIDKGPHQYAVTWGSHAFRQALARKQSHFMGLELDPEQHLVVTCGSTEAMIAALLTVCEPGDKVIVFSPFYENYGADSILSGAEPLFVQLKPPAFTFDEAELEAAFAQGAKALILCNPSNPCGKVFSLEELQIIARLAERYDTFVITDEVYEHIVYPPHQHHYFATLPGIALQDLLHHRLALGLCHSPERGDRRHSQGPRLSHRRRRRPLAGGRRYRLEF